MKNFRSIVLCLLLTAAGAAAFSQGKTPPAWTARFKSPINWQRIHTLGYLIVSTRDALYGVSPGDGKILWENKQFPALDPSLYEEVAGTELLTIGYQKDDDSTIPMQAIVEVISGKILFDSKREMIGVLSRHVLAESGKLLVVGASKGDLAAKLFMYDIASGNKLWENAEIFKAEAAGKGFMAKLQAGLQSLSNLQGLLADPVELDEQHLLLVHPNMAMRLETATGTVKWKNDLQPSVAGQVLFSPYQKNTVFIATEIESESGSGFTTTSSTSQGQPQKFAYNVYYAFDVVSGKPVWKEPARENDKLNVVIMHEKGIIVCPRSTQKPTINLIDYTTGQMVWGKKGKGIKAQGSVVSYLPTERGILLTTGFDNAFNQKGEEYYLNILDPATGALRYEKSVKLKGDIVQSELTPKGLLFATTREVNILELSTGTLLWDKSIEAGGPATGEKVRPFPVGEKDDRLYVYSPREEGLFEVNKSSGIYRKMSLSKITFEGKEMPRAIDVVDDGVILLAEQNIMKVALDGKLLYSRYYPAPRQPALVRALLLAEAVRAAYIGAAASTYSAAFAQASQQSSDPAGKALGNQMSSAFADLGNAGFAYSSQAMKQFNARFKASQNTPAFVMMMTAQEKKGNQLVQVSKQSGEVQNSIDIKNDKEPEYEVDQVFNFVYYRPSPSEMVCYKL